MIEVFYMGINEYIKIGNRIKQLRIEKGYTQKEMAALSEISYSTYSNYENNNREPSMKQIEKIAKALNISTEDLLGYTNKIPIPSGCVDNENYHLLRLLKEKDDLSEKQIKLDRSYDSGTETGRADYAATADFLQFRLKRVLDDINEFYNIILEKNNNKLSLPYKVLFSLQQINPDGIKRILEEIEILSYDPKYRTPLKPDDWDPYDDI